MSVNLKSLQKVTVRVERAAKILIESGYKHIYNMYGTMQWPYELVR